MNDELDIAAAEFVLGTLPGDERSRFAERLLADPEARRAVRDWERRLVPLAGTAATETIPGGLWARIEAMISGQPGAARGSVLSLNTARLRRSVVVWRSAAAAATAVAAVSLAWIFAGDQIAPTAAPGTQYVAVVNAGGSEPALIAEVDTGRGLIRIRSLQAETPPGRSLELWHIPNGQSPRSLGVLKVGGTVQDIRDQISPSAVDGQIAVTVEPEGGSPSGAPTGQVVYSGRLVPMDN